MYLAVKITHIVSAIASISLFTLRGGLVLSGRSLTHWSLRLLPHVVDTVLLASAIALAWMLRQAPFTDAWLTAKLMALLLYIVLGTLALKRAPTRNTRAVAFVGALLVFAYIVGVAITRSAWSWLPIN
jgi:uncharacterized membrane protein SirB2